MARLWNVQSQHELASWRNLPCTWSVFAHLPKGDAEQAHGLTKALSNVPAAQLLLDSDEIEEPFLGCLLPLGSWILSSSCTHFLEVLFLRTLVLTAAAPENVPKRKRSWTIQAHAKLQPPWHKNCHTSWDARCFQKSIHPPLILAACGLSTHCFGRCHGCPSDFDCALRSP